MCAAVEQFGVGLGGVSVQQVVLWWVGVCVCVCLCGVFGCCVCGVCV